MPAINFTNTLTGTSETAAAFEALPDLMQLDALRPAVDKANRLMANAEKAAAPRGETGTLKAAMGASAVKLYPRKGVVWAAAGVRRGWGRSFIPVANPGQVRKPKRVGKRGERLPGAVFKNPVKYAHFVIGGRGPIAVNPRKAKVLYSALTGTVFGRSARSVAGRDFMASAYASSSGQAQQILEQEIPRGIEKCWNRLARRAG